MAKPPASKAPRGRATKPKAAAKRSPARPAAERAGPQATAAELVVERLRLHLAQARGEEFDAAALADVESRLQGPEAAPRARLATLFNLTPAECDALDCAVAVAVEPNLAAPLAALQGMPQRGLPCEIGLRLLFGHGPRPVVRGGSPLTQWGLVEEVQFTADEPTFFRADPAVVDWYFGVLSASAIPLRRVRRVEPLPEWRIAEHARRIAAILADNRAVRVTITGRRGSGRASLADCLARALGRQALCVDPDVLEGSDHATLFQRLQRLALIGNLVLIWRGLPERWPAGLPVAAIQVLTLEPGQSPAPVDELVDLVIAMPHLGAATLDGLYKNYLPELASTSEALPGEPRIGDLADAAAQRIGDAHELRDFLRQRNAARTYTVGRVEPANAGWDDLILDKATMDRLRSLTDEAMQRRTVLADPERARVFGDTAHLSALFTGPPGLGKSMSARIIASALNMDLLTIDTAAITSKFIGDTAKNLTQAFEVARDAQCALHFEEAEAFFAARVNKVETANDRHTNADVGHLLQLMERFEGVVILSTNRRAALDAAFTRRLRFIIEFRKPDAEQRERLWKRMLSVAGMAADACEAIAPRLALAHELTPAQIKGAALTAAYRAGDGGIVLSNVEEGIRLELQKEGRLASAVEAPALTEARHG
jgi:hypothetical protein